MNLFIISLLPVLASLTAGSEVAIERETDETCLLQIVKAPVKKRSIKDLEKDLEKRSVKRKDPVNDLDLIVEDAEASEEGLETQVQEQALEAEEQSENFEQQGSWADGTSRSFGTMSDGTEWDSTGDLKPMSDAMPMSDPINGFDPIDGSDPMPMPDPKPMGNPMPMPDPMPMGDPMPDPKPMGDPMPSPEWGRGSGKCPWDFDACSIKMLQEICHPNSIYEHSWGDDIPYHKCPSVSELKKAHGLISQASIAMDSVVPTSHRSMARAHRKDSLLKQRMQMLSEGSSSYANSIYSQGVTLDQNDYVDSPQPPQGPPQRFYADSPGPFSQGLMPVPEPQLYSQQNVAPAGGSQDMFYSQGSSVESAPVPVQIGVVVPGVVVASPAVNSVNSNPAQLISGDSQVDLTRADQAPAKNLDSLDFTRANQAPAGEMVRRAPDDYPGVNLRMVNVDPN